MTSSHARRRGTAGSPPLASVGLFLLRLLAALATACAASPPGAFVSAPAEVPPPPRAPPPIPSRDAPSGDLSPACERSWKLSDVADAPGQVVVVCGSDVRREPLDSSGPIAQMLLPGLEPTRERVCACAKRLRPPPFVDLVFTARPESGRVTVEASEVDDLDAEHGGPFIACLGTVVALFAPRSSDACSKGAAGATKGKVVLVYPARVDLAP